VVVWSVLPTQDIGSAFKRCDQHEEGHCRVEVIEGLERRTLFSLHVTQMRRMETSQLDPYGGCWSVKLLVGWVGRVK